MTGLTGLVITETRWEAALSLGFAVSLGSGNQERFVCQQASVYVCTVFNPFFGLIVKRI